jgi:DNA uptake protein ComE-like DNA-binding protein
LPLFAAALRHRILTDPYYRLQSAQEIQVAASLGIKIDVNQACVDDWLRLPGISIHQARFLVKLTQSGGQFHCLDDIAAVLNLSMQRLQAWQPILSFRYYDPESLDTQPRLNANTASWEELMTIPGIDPSLAQAIVQQRTRSDNFRNWADFQNRLSLPGSVVTTLIHYLKF